MKKPSERAVLQWAVWAQLLGVLLLAATLFTTVPILLTVLLPSGTALVLMGTAFWAWVALKSVL